MTKSANQCELYVEGMHCAACEILIEKKLKEEFSAKDVKASLSENKVTFTTTNDNFSLNKANKIFREFGYKLVSQKPANASSKNGLLLGLLVLAVFFIVNSLGQGINFSVSNSSSIPAFFLFGVVASLSSCAALVGGVLLALSKQWSVTYAKESYAPYILFNTGRVIAFILLGGVLGVIGDVVGLSTSASSVLVLAVSLYMIVVGLQQLNVKYFARLKISYPKVISSYAANEKNFAGRYLPFAAGALTFFIPCGFTIVAQGLAVTSGSFLGGAVIMGSFVLGTLPSLALISYSSVKFMQKPAVAAKFSYIAGVLILFFGIYSVNSQLNALGLPSLSDINASSLLTPVKDFIKLAEGGAPTVTTTKGIVSGQKQLVQIEADGFAYYPRNIELQSGVLTRLEILNKGAVGCANSVVGRGLFDGVLTLRDGINFVEFTPKTPGNYKITCSMGMVPPVSVRVI